LRPEAAGLEQGSGDIASEVAEAEGGAAEVFESAVDGFGGSVAGAGPVEVGQDVGAGPSVDVGPLLAMRSLRGRISRIRNVRQ
jgi:hypothetical protein